jgi:hypothetical protein
MVIVGCSSQFSLMLMKEVSSQDSFQKGLSHYCFNNDYICLCYYYLLIIYNQSAEQVQPVKRSKTIFVGIIKDDNG